MITQGRQWLLGYVPLPPFLPPTFSACSFPTSKQNHKTHLKRKKKKKFILFPHKKHIKYPGHFYKQK